MALHTVGTVNDHGPIPQPRRFESVSATLSWTSAGNAQDLDLAIVAPGKQGSWHQAQAADVEGWFVDRGGAHGLPDSPATVKLDQSMLEKFNGCDPAAACEWSAWALAKGAVAQASFSIRIDVVFAEETEA